MPSTHERPTAATSPPPSSSPTSAAGRSLYRRQSVGYIVPVMTEACPSPPGARTPVAPLRWEAGVGVRVEGVGGSRSELLDGINAAQGPFGRASERRYGRLTGRTAALAFRISLRRASAALDGRAPGPVRLREYKGGKEGWKIFLLSFLPSSSTSQRTHGRAGWGGRPAPHLSAGPRAQRWGTGGGAWAG